MIFQKGEMQMNEIKAKWENAKCEVVGFELVDIITASGSPSGEYDNYEGEIDRI